MLPKVMSGEVLQMNSQNDGAGGFCTFAISFWHSTWNDNHDSRGKPYIQPHILRPICRLSLLAHRALLLVVVPHHPKKRWLQTLYKCPCDDWNTTLILSGHISTTSILLWDAWKHLSTTTEISQQGLFHQFSKMLLCSLCSSFVVALQHFVSKKHTLGTSWWSRSQLFGIDVVVIRLTYIYSRR